MSQFDRVLPGFRFVETFHGDTLQRIAAREMNDASQWSTLAHLNELVPPYFIEPDQPATAGLLRYGDMLMVPAASASIGGVTDPDLVFEKDCALTAGLLTSENGDFVVVGGRANLRQALQHRIRTDQGELIFHPEYRCLVHRLIGAMNGPTAGLLAGEYVKAALLRDSRIQEVTQVDVQITGDTISVLAEAVPITGRTITVEV
jgi:phage baseplate assembly protein W